MFVEIFIERLWDLLSCCDFFLFWGNLINFFIMNTIFYFVKIVLSWTICFSTKFEFFIMLKRWSDILLTFIVIKAFFHTGTVAISIKKKVKDFNIFFLNLSVSWDHFFWKIKLKLRYFLYILCLSFFIRSLLKIELIFIISSKCKNLLADWSDEDSSLIEKVKIVNYSTVQFKIFNKVL